MMEPYQFIDELSAIIDRYPQADSEMFYLQSSAVILHDIMMWEGDLDRAVEGYLYPAKVHENDTQGDWFSDPNGEMFDMPIAQALRYAVGHHA